MRHSKALNKITPKQAERKRARARQKAYLREYERGWKKVLKHDLDGDWEPIVAILKYKLERTRKCIVGNNIVSDAKKVGRQIARVEYHLGRLLDDPYHDEAFKDFNEKYGEPKMIFIDPTEEEKKKFPHMGGTMEFLYRDGKPATEEMHKEMRKLYRREMALQRKDLRKALKIIEKHLFEWWD